MICITIYLLMFSVFNEQKEAEGHHCTYHFQLKKDTIRATRTKSVSMTMEVSDSMVSTSGPSWSSDSWVAILLSLYLLHICVLSWIMSPTLTMEKQ